MRATGAEQRRESRVRAYGSTHVLAMGTDYALWHKSDGSGTWSGYDQLGTEQIKAVGATSPSYGRIDAFVIGTDNALWHKTGTFPYFPEGAC